MSNKKAWFFNKGVLETPHLLNFDGINQDFLGSNGAVGYKIFSGAFYMDIDFEYSAFDSSYAILFGKLTVNGSLRLLVNNSISLTSVNNNTNMSNSYARALNTKYNIRISRDVSNNCYISNDGGADEFLGVRAGDVHFISVGFSQRYLTGKVYRFNINGEEFACNEGSGDTVTGDQGTVLPINTSNVGGINYINNTMWEAI